MSLNQAPLPKRLPSLSLTSAMPLTVLKLGKSYSSYTPPLSRRPLRGAEASVPPGMLRRGCPRQGRSSFGFLPVSGLGGRRPARWLGGGRAGRRQLRDGACHRFVGHEGDGGAVMSDVERGALEQGVAGLPVVYRYLDPAPPEEEAEGQAGEPLRELGRKAERAAVVAHAPEPGHRGDPGAGQGS